MEKTQDINKELVAAHLVLLLLSFSALFLSKSSLSHASNAQFLTSLKLSTFISIDFGSSDSEPYTDENSITWTGDDAFQSGESQFLKYSTMPYARDEQSQGVLIAGKKKKKLLQD
ncbi:hypothetical protein NC653_028951 [Populus alba x Populus x berolinensis]|uniref:Uncharacterized protein n=1 Tax=Populus alba x Populus x berolinensis TaxID=444605 RepID=A0AAD6M0X7_9ROSI|nr:hypothetical protein NC653_028951 [Populus alba x Populus x berolinensis]